MAFSSWLAYEYVRDSREDSERAASLVARNVAAALDEQITALIAALTVLAEAPSLKKGDIAGFYDRARDFLPRHGENVVLVDAHRHQLFNTRKPRGETLPLANPAQGWARVFSTGRAVVTDVFIGAESKKPLVAILVPVRRGGGVPYALGVSVSLESLQKLIRAAALPEDWLLGILDGEGRLIARNLNPEKVVGEPAVPPLREMARTGADGRVGSISKEGVPHYNIIVGSKSSGWSVAVGVPQDLLEAPARRAAIALSVALTLVVGATGLGAGLAGRRLERAVTALANESDPLPSGIAEVDAARAALRRASEEERIARAAAEKASFAKSRFLAGVSHDLRQPYQAMALFHSYLSGQLTEPQHRRALEGLGAAMKSSEDLLNALVQISVLEAGTQTAKICATRMGDLIEPLVKECRPDAEAAGLVLKHVPCSAVVDTDRALLARILRNFLSNAIRHTPTGKVLLGCRRVGACVRIEVWDTGPGIPSNKLAEVFDEFVQLGQPDPTRARGWGLGLAIVSRIARLLGHEVEVRSWPGRGLVFSVEVPRSSAETASDGLTGRTTLAT
ncbi:MAG: sensor histidine kinase [Rhodospirillales bacterium]|nr:sensor histidine kinase [Rhodospirillales bacterium]